MGLKDFFSLFGQFQYIQGIEGKLRERQKNGAIVTIVTILLGLIEIIRELSDSNEFLFAYFSRVFQHIVYTISYLPQNLYYLVTNQRGLLFNYQASPDVIGFYMILVGVVVYLINRNIAFFFKTSEEPFQYTFWINRFTRAEDRDSNTESISEDNNIHHLLHHDLMDILNRRIRPFSLLDEKNFQTDVETDRTPLSHIRIDGHYALRRDEDRKWFLQVMPRVTIGPNSPSILTQPVEVYLDYEDQQIEEIKRPSISDLPTGKYDEIREQVYSKVASEIYKQIKDDIAEKINLFPTKFLRASALYYEAEDFSKSNTLDAYEYSLELYKEAEKQNNLSIRLLLTRLMRIFRLRSIDSDYQLLHAKIIIGYARSFFYRRAVAFFTGRTNNDAPYGIPKELANSITTLISIHKKFRSIKIQVGDLDDITQNRNRQNLTLSALSGRSTSIWGNRKKEHKSKVIRKALFDAYVILSIMQSELENQKPAEEHLENARATLPGKCESDPLYLLAKALTQERASSRIPYLTQSRELDPMFQICQLLLAREMFSVFLQNGEINRDRAEIVIKEFKAVLKINPGNIAAYAQLGYIYWLIEDQKEAEKWFQQGINVKSIVQQTFIGELMYGQARITAESGRFNKCFDLYTESLSIEPGLGAYGSVSVTGKPQSTAFYTYMTPTLLARYEKMAAEFRQQRRLKGFGDRTSRHIISKAYSFVLNDCGNARLNYFFRMGDREQLHKASTAFRQAIRRNNQNGITYFNAAIAEGWQGNSELRETYLRKANNNLNTTLISVAIENAKSATRYLRQTITELTGDIEQINKEISMLREEIETDNQTVAGLKKEIGDQSTVASTQTRSENKGRSLTTDDKLKQKEEELESKKSELAKKDDKLKQKEEELESKKEDYYKSVYEIRRIVELSDVLSSITKGIDLDIEGKGIKEFTEIDINQDSLTEKDIRILISWIDILSNNLEKKQVQEAVATMCNYISKLPVNSFDLDLIKYSLLQAISKDDPEKDIIKKRIAKTIESWLKEDPIHYVALDGWAVSELDFVTAEKYLRNALEKVDRHHASVYHNILAELYEKEKASNNFKQAMIDFPEQGVYHLKLVTFLRKNGNTIEAKRELDSAFNKQLISQDGLERELEQVMKVEAKTYEETKDWQQVELIRKQALKLLPKNKFLLAKLESTLKNRKIIDSYGEQRLFMIVTPIAIEVASDLTSLIKDESFNLRKEFEKAISEMRDRILGKFGIKIPGLRFRDNDDGSLPNGSYIFMIKEIPTIMGETPTDDNQIEHLLRDLEEFLERNLMEFLGHQEVMDLIESPFYHDKADYYSRHPKELSRLLSVLRGLLSTGTSIKALRSIMEYTEKNKAEKNLSKLINKVRLLPEVRKDLPGKHGTSRIWALDAEIEAVIERGVRIAEEQDILAMIPEYVQEILSACRNYVSNEKDEVIVIANASLRQVIRPLLVLDFPNVAVISQDEIVDGTGDWLKNMQEIRLS